MKMEISESKKTQDVEMLFKSVEEMNGFCISVQSVLSSYDVPKQMHCDLMGSVQELNRQILLGINWIINPNAPELVDAVKERAAKIAQNPTTA